jgi:hypothetical protein
MKDYVLDENAVIRYFKVGNAGGGERVQKVGRQSLQRTAIFPDKRQSN